MNGDEGEHDQSVRRYCDVCDEEAVIRVWEEDDAYHYYCMADGCAHPECKDCTGCPDYLEWCFPLSQKGGELNEHMV